VRGISTIPLSVMLAACAGYHTVPPSDYSVAPPPVQRVVFDQAGDPYPLSDDAGGLAIPDQPPNKNRAFTLRVYFQQRGVAYNREPILDAAADRIVAGMRSTNAKRVVFIIKGFNNSYDDFEREYTWMRDQVIGKLDPDNVYFVQIYWDAIYRGKGTAPAPLAYFADSLTYSNHAGDCGLRDILRRLPTGTDVTFLTHSRGAAVALSSLFDPKYDKGITNNCQSSIMGHSLPDQLGDVRLVAFAPAIGDGHMRDSRDAARTGIFKRLDRLYIGYNPNDPAVTKNYFGINIPDRFAGDTRLGGNTGYVELIDKMLANAGLGDAFQFERFSRKSHDWEEYVTMSKETGCLLWAGKLITREPAGCSVTR